MTKNNELPNNNSAEFTTLKTWIQNTPLTSLNSNVTPETTNATHNHPLTNSIQDLPRKQTYSEMQNYFSFFNRRDDNNSPSYLKLMHDPISTNLSTVKKSENDENGLALSVSDSSIFSEDGYITLSHNPPPISRNSSNKTLTYNLELSHIDCEAELSPFGKGDITLNHNPFLIATNYHLELSHIDCEAELSPFGKGDIKLNHDPFLIATNYDMELPQIDHGYISTHQKPQIILTNSLYKATNLDVELSSTGDEVNLAGVIEDSNSLENNCCCIIL